MQSPAFYNRGVVVLPLEIWDNIINHLWNEQEALSACSLTCRAMLPASHYHMFSRVDIYEADDLASFTALLAEDNCVAQYVRMLSVSPPYRDGDDPDRFRFPTNGKWMCLLPKLPKLSRLYLHNSCFCFPSHKLRDAVHSLAPRLQIIHLDKMDFEENDLALLLKQCLSPTLICYALTTFLRDSLRPVYSPTTDSPLRNLDTLVWDPGFHSEDGFHSGDHFAVETMTRWTQGIPLRLRRLAVRRIFIGTPLSFVQGLLDASADSLEHLFIHFDGMLHDPAHLLNLAGNTRLQTLHIVIQSYRVPSLTVVLSRLDSPHASHALTSIVIRFIVYSYDYEDSADPIDPADWQQLCAQLVQLCTAHPSLHCTLCFDLPMYAGAPPTFPQVYPGRSLTRQQVRRVRDWTAALPHPSHTDGRVRFAVVWMCIDKKEFSAGFDPRRCLPAEYYLGDPEWYYEVYAPYVPGDEQ